MPRWSCAYMTTSMTPTAASSEVSLYSKNELAGHRGDNAAHRLRDDNEKHGLRTVHAQRARGLELALC